MIRSSIDSKHTRQTRECPLCGGTMHPQQSTRIARIPGFAEAHGKTTEEWVCPDCDYFEDAAEDW